MPLSISSAVQSHSLHLNLLLNRPIKLLRIYGRVSDKKSSPTTPQKALDHLSSGSTSRWLCWRRLRRCLRRKCSTLNLWKKDVISLKSWQTMRTEYLVNCAMSSLLLQWVDRKTRKKQTSWSNCLKQSLSAMEHHLSWFSFYLSSSSGLSMQLTEKTDYSYSSSYTRLSKTYLKASHARKQAVWM